MRGNPQIARSEPGAGTPEARPVRAHQLIDRFRPGEELTETALDLGLLLRRCGLPGGLFAASAAPGFGIVASHPSEMELGPDDLVFAHLGPPSEVLGRWMHLKARRVLVFHGSPEDDLEVSRHSRAQLATAAGFAERTLVFSRSSAEEARAAGHTQVTLLPTFVEVDRYTSARKRTPQAGFTVVAAARPGIRDALAAIASELQRIGGRLNELPASHAERIGALQNASVFLALGDNSGRRIAEAMASLLPVIAFSTGAAPEVLGTTGVQFDSVQPAPIAELARQLARDPKLHQKVARGQLQRVTALADDAQRTVSELFAGPRPAPPQPRLKARRRIAIVVQRYGDVGGGAERQARMIAERLAPHLPVEVLTSRSRDHLRWDQTFPPGLSEEQGVSVRRFESAHRKDLPAFNAYTRLLFERLGSTDRAGEERWVREQGPVLRGLEEHLAATPYDAVLAFTYLYWPTLAAATLGAGRTLVIPEAHPEPALELGIYADVFERPAALLCNTPEEVSLIARRFPRHARARVVGVGIEPAPEADPGRFRRKYELDRPFLLYVGRLERAKGLEELVRYHRALIETTPEAPQLVLAGTGELGERLASRHVRSLGRITDQDKYDGLGAALAAVVPSRLESLSLFALEAFSVGTPVIGNAKSEVVAGQLERSGAGAPYTTAGTFIAAVEQVLREREELGKRGLRFAAKHRWDEVVAAYLEEIERVARGNR